MTLIAAIAIASLLALALAFGLSTGPAELPVPVPCQGGKGINPAYDLPPPIDRQGPYAWDQPRC